MRVLFVIETCSGGSGRHLLDLGIGISQLGHEVHIAYSPLRASAQFVSALTSHADIQLFELPMRTAPGLSDISSIIRLRRYLKENGPFDIVHGHSSKGGALARMAALATGVRKIYTPHAFYTMNPALGTFKRGIYGMIERVLARYATDVVISVSEDELAHAVGENLPAGKIKLVVNGVSAPNAQKLAHDRKEARSWLGVSDSTFVIGFVGRLDYQKAPERLVNLAMHLKDSGRDIQFVVLGSGAQASELKGMIGRCGLGSDVHLLGDESGEDFMPAFDMFLLTSRYEAMPYVLLEALAAHLPIVSTEVGGARTVIEDGVNGYIVPQQDNLELMQDRVLALYDQPDLRKRFQTASASRVLKFSDENMVLQTLALYEDGQYQGKQRSLASQGLMVSNE